MSETAATPLPHAMPLSTARYIHAALGELALLARQAQMDTTEAMILAARIEALSVMQRLRAGPSQARPLAGGHTAAGRGNGKAG